MTQHTLFWMMVGFMTYLLTSSVISNRYIAFFVSVVIVVALAGIYGH